MALMPINEQLYFESRKRLELQGPFSRRLKLRSFGSAIPAARLVGFTRLLPKGAVRQAAFGVDPGAHGRTPEGSNILSSLTMRRFTAISPGVLVAQALLPVFDTWDDRALSTGRSACATLQHQIECERLLGEVC
jgi:hypothetical protein